MKKSHEHKIVSSLRRPLAILGAVAGILMASAVAVPGHSVPDDDTPVPQIPTADRYVNGRVFLEQADKLLKTSAGADYQVVTGNVIFRRGDMYMYCDSAHFYDRTNSLQAFGNVRMEQGDTLFVYADELEYTDSTEMAILYADPGKKVRLINRNVTLRTDVFNYDMGIELGYYDVGGELDDKTNRLTSVYGEYAPKTKDAIFRYRVHLEGFRDNDTLNIWTESLLYNTDTHVAELDQASTITSKDGIIYTSKGFYNTETSVSDLYDHSLVVTATGRTLEGDTLFYDRNKGYGEAWGNMVLNDTINHMKLKGDYGYYNELTDSAFVTGRAIAVDYSSADSLSLHGDTIKAFRIITLPDTAKSAIPESILADLEMTAMLDSISAQEDTIANPDSTDTIVAERTITEVTEPKDTMATLVTDTTVVVPDSLSAQPEILTKIELPVIKQELPDTTHHIVAYPNVRFYRTDLQGTCDSMTFIQKDSLLYMDIDPIVWSGERQITGSQIQVHLNDSTADRIFIPSESFMAEALGEGFYNQLSGRQLTATLEGGDLRHVDVSGNVLIIYFPMEEDSTYNKVANAESSFLAADFQNRELKRMKLWPQSNETITPLWLAKKSIFTLQGFNWRSEGRPTSHNDVLPRPAKETLYETADEPLPTSRSDENEAPRENDKENFTEITETPLPHEEPSEGTD